MRAAYRRLAAIGLAVGVGAATADPPGRPFFAQPVRPAATGGFTPDLDIAIPAADAVPSALALAALTASPTANGPVVLLDWAGPATARKGRPVPYTLTVRNHGGQPARRVTVQVRPPAGATLGNCQPAGRVEDGVHLWDMGTLAAGEGKPLRLTLTAGERGELACQAWVTVTGSAGMTVQVQEPKLAVAVSGPSTVPAGEPAEFTYVIRNVGTGRAESVVLSGVGGQDDAGRTSSLALDPGQEQVCRRTLTLAQPGVQKWEVLALTADLDLSEPVTQTVKVVAPKLEATLDGPAVRRVGRPAAYTLTLRNVGDHPADEVAVEVALPAGLKAAPGWPAAGKVVVGHLPAGGVQQVRFEATATAPGPQTLTATAAGRHGAKATAAARTEVVGEPALRCELADSVDPVEAGGETVYEVRLLNTGTAPDADVRVTCELPPGLAFVSADGPTAHAELPADGRVSRVVAFDPVRELAPKTEAVFRVRVKAVAAGDVRVRAVVTSKHLTAPVVKEESTRVVGD